MIVEKRGYPKGSFHSSSNKMGLLFLIIPTNFWAFSFSYIPMTLAYFKSHASVDVMYQIKQSIEFNSTWHSKWMYLLSHFRRCPIHAPIYQTLVWLSPSFSWRLCHDNEGKISSQAMICSESLSFVTMRIFVMHKWGVEAGENYSLMSGSHNTTIKQIPDLWQTD